MFKINGNQLSEAETVHDNYEKTITREHASSLSKYNQNLMLDDNVENQDNWNEY